MDNTDTTNMDKSESLEIHKALKIIRTFHDLKQYKLAKKLKISKSYLSEIELGKKTPNIKLLKNYAEIFEIPISSIIFLAENINVNDTTEINDFISPKIITLIKFMAERSI